MKQAPPCRALLAESSTISTGEMPGPEIQAAKQALGADETVVFSGLQRLLGKGSCHQKSEQTYLR